MTDQITVSVDPDVAKFYRASSPGERRKLDLLVNLRLRDVASSGRSLEDVVREMSRNAQRRGLTEEALQSIVAE